MSLDLRESGDWATQSIATIKVVGVGGAGNNAINRIYKHKIDGISCISTNTDAQVLHNLKADQKIVLGRGLTRGQGAGGRPEVGLRAAEENKDELKETLVDADMVFIMAGMGGGTGTGAAPYTAKIAKEMGRLVIGVVTLPFDFEGREKMLKAEEGIRNLRQHVDSLIILKNDKIANLMDEDLTFDQAFEKVDEVLYMGVKAVSDLITTTGYMNIDFADVRMVMEKQGNALLGIGSARGQDRAQEAVYRALKHPLLQEISIQGAQGILVNITGSGVGIREFKQVMQLCHDFASDAANIKCGLVENTSMGDELTVTLIATGFSGYDENHMNTMSLHEEKEVKQFKQLREEMNTPPKKMQSTSTFGDLANFE